MLNNLFGSPENKKKYFLSFCLVVSLFFFWAFVHNINGTLIPHLKRSLSLTDIQSSLIDTSIYFAYFLAALPAGLLINKFGYKKTIITGLLLFAFASLLFIPAAKTGLYSLFLLALFIFGCGAAFLETSANPYISQLGDRNHSAQRLNFAQSFNGLGAVITPIIGGMFILSNNEIQNPTKEQLLTEANSVIIPYTILAIVVILVALLFYKIPLSEKIYNERKKSFRNILNHRHLIFASITQFFYVGAQVSLGSFVVAYSEQITEISKKDVLLLWGSFAMGGFMIGRFLGTFLLKYLKPEKLLLLFAILASLFLIISLTTTGNISLYSFMIVPFFLSIMFPTIFDLGISYTGEDAKIGSSLLIMSIVGGAIIPYFVAQLAQLNPYEAEKSSFQTGYWIVLLCLVIVILFSLSYPKLIEKYKYEFYES